MYFKYSRAAKTFTSSEYLCAPFSRTSGAFTNCYRSLFINSKYLYVLDSLNFLALQFSDVDTERSKML